ncbi:hypothetical protein [Salisediminibacterium beveridgei]|uniref:Uncharacterized protein n=1 Tax=Salisediminibacterium beveridgei TaxID=632773 RepID=A0A1D7QV44_9BACI|nr:hypothetical protein [Salisediminibacterium beveridgei]AOM82882.1 hypothetical protein BBEV_1519 [Salisediminibacterium beveridgei]
MSEIIMLVVLIVGGLLLFRIMGTIIRFVITAGLLVVIYMVFTESTSAANLLL